MIKKLFLVPILAFCIYAMLLLAQGCAQVGYPTGGARDSIAPVLLKATPENNKINFTGNKISLVFDEYIELKELSNNILISPVQKNNPVVGSNLKTISIRFRDTLRPNTTYSINFGNAITDVHEGNVFKNFTYSFSTGDHIDSLQLSGRVIMAETGKVDSTLLVMLYQEAPDSAVKTRKPDYIAKLDGDGKFNFKNLPAASFKVYALKDGDGSKTYNGKTEYFGFPDSSAQASLVPKPVLLYAYAEEKPVDNKAGGTPPRKPVEKTLRFTTNLSNKTQDLLQPLEISFNKGLKKFDSSAIMLVDTNYRKIATRPLIDSSRSKASINIAWKAGTKYILVVPREAIEDSTGLVLDKSDTIAFTTKKNEDYGTLLLRFKNLPLDKHPVIQFLQNDNIKISAALLTNEYSNKMFPPGDYDIRILFDTNKNLQWDPGNYANKLQPEISILLPQKLTIKADWENEREIQF